MTKKHILKPGTAACKKWCHTALSYCLSFSWSAVTVTFTMAIVPIGFLASLWHDWSAAEIRFSPVATLVLAGVIELFRHHPHRGTFMMLMGLDEYLGRTKHRCNATILELGHYTAPEDLRQLLHSGYWPYGYVNTCGETVAKVSCPTKSGTETISYLRISKHLLETVQVDQPIPVSFQFSRDTLLTKPKILVKLLH